MIERPRRLRRTLALREALKETRLSRSQLVQPHFVMEGDDGESPVPSMPGIARQSISGLVDQVGRDREAGILCHLLFGITDDKDDRASSATDPEGLVPRTISALREAHGENIVIMTDVCLCGSMEHGHCGVLKDGEILNDPSLPLLAAMAVSHAAAGADVVAPSDMMDGRVEAIRGALDEANHDQTAILSYSSKFASAFYGPFRDAADSAPQSGDRNSYQLDSSNRREALKESMLDESEGADMLMVKPALSYLDVIGDLRRETLLPIAAYNVSGEYSMVKAGSEKGWVDESRLVPEILGSMARAGADLIITYHGREACQEDWV